MKKKNNNNVTKWVILIFAFVLVCSIVITELMAANNTKLAAINVSTYTSLISGQDEKMVLLTKDNDKKSTDMAKILNKLQLEGNVTYYSINVDKISDSEMKTIADSSKLLKDVKAPAIIHISTGEVIGVYSGKADASSIEEFGTVFKSLSVSQYNDFVKEDVEHFIFIGRPTCGYCVQSMPWVKRVAYDLGNDVYYLDIDKETPQGLKDLSTYTSGLYNGSTPLFLITKNGQITNHLTGAGSYTSLSDFFSKKPVSGE